jgi:hypothetical protein
MSREDVERTMNAGPGASGVESVLTSQGIQNLNSSLLDLTESMKAALLHSGGTNIPGTSHSFNINDLLQMIHSTSRGVNFATPEVNTQGQEEELIIDAVPGPNGKSDGSSGRLPSLTDSLGLSSSGSGLNSEQRQLLDLLFNKSQSNLDIGKGEGDVQPGLDTKDSLIAQLERMPQPPSSDLAAMLSSFSNKEIDTLLSVRIPIILMVFLFLYYC